MSSINNYLELIEHNSKLLDLITGTRPAHLINEDFSDWQVTIIFYMSCIYLKAVCFLFGEDVQDHYTLRQKINTRKELYTIAKFYRHIEEASRDARYEGRKFNKDFIVKTILPKFNKVRDCAVAIIKSKGITSAKITNIESILDRS